MSHELIDVLGKTFAELRNSDLLAQLGSPSDDVETGHRRRINLPHAGISFGAEEDRIVRGISIHSEGYQGYHGYTRSLPDGIEFSDSREQVRIKLGEPSKANDGGEIIPGFGKMQPWDRYDHDDYSLHLRYSDDGTSILLVTVMAPDAVP